MLELCAIASGSSGNSICVGSDHTHVLIDAGVSGKRIENGLNEIEEGKNIAEKYGISSQVKWLGWISGESKDRVFNDCLDVFRR